MSFFSMPDPARRPPPVPRPVRPGAVRRRGRAARRQPRARRQAGGRQRRGDAQILNTALGAELEAIAAYQVGAESRLLQKPALDLALTFQGHHKEHASCSQDVEKLGGKPVAAKAKYDFPVAS